MNKESSSQNTPYSTLDPTLILEAIETLGFKCDGSFFALNSYENRVYQIGIEDEAPIIAKFYRPQRWANEAIIEEHQFAAELAEHEIPIIAPIKINTTLHQHQGFRFALFPRKGGRTLELDNLEQLEWMGRFIGRLHAVGACKTFKHRIKLDINSYGHQPYQFLLNNNFIPAELKQSFIIVIEAILQKIDQIFKQVGAVRYIRLHGDCHPGNILWNNDGPQIVDLDDCLMGPAIQDMWMLLSSHAEAEVEIQLERILRGYKKFYEFDSRELHLIESLRTLRMLHYCAWLAKRWTDPTFPLNFPWFNTAQYWQKQLHDLKEQWELLENTENFYL